LEVGEEPVLLKRQTQEIVDNITEGISNPEERKSPPLQVVSTGSTLLDLAICGKVIKGGGLPSGNLVEVFGPSGAGKTSILAEIAASCQAHQGDVLFLDPEARLNQEYSRIYGVELNPEQYLRPDTVTEMFEKIWDWKPKSEGGINGVFADSLAALSTKMEIDDEDKYGMRRAKEFSEGLRKTCRLIANNNWVVVCSNQLREGPSGETTPGGRAIPYYSSLRIRVGPPAQGGKIVKTITLSNGKKHEKVIGIRSNCIIKKSSLDDPFRSCFISILFGYGIDDIRENLQYLKDGLGLTKYKAVDQEFGFAEKAITHIEENKLQDQLKQEVITLWEEIESKFTVIRGKKVR
jgi:recombination protein RecA